MEQATGQERTAGIVKRMGCILGMALAASFCTRLAGQTDPVTSASQLIRSGQYQQAVAAADDALRRKNNDPRLLTLKGLALSKLNRSAEAITSLRQALQENPNFLPALAALAQAEYETHDPRAKHDLDQLLTLKPNDPVAHGMRAVIEYRTGDCQAAVVDFAAAQDQLSVQPVALHQYGACLVRLKQLPAARQVFTRLLELDSNNKSSLHALATVLLMSEDYQGVLDRLSGVLQSGDDARGLALAAAAYEALGRTAEAVAALRKAIVLDPDQPDFYLQFSSLCLEHKSYQVGVSMIDAGLSRMPQSPALYLARGVLRAQLGEYERADQDFSKAALLDPQRTDASGAQALAEIQAGHLERALIIVEDRIARNPRDAFLHYLRAEILSKQGADPKSREFVQAVQSARRAVDLRPDFVLARDVLSRLYLESGEVAHAIAECRQTLEYDNKDQIALYRLVRALQADGAERHKNEIQVTLKRLNGIRIETRRREEQTSQFKLVEAPEATGINKK